MLLYLKWFMILKCHLSLLKSLALFVVICSRGSMWFLVVVDLCWHSRSWASSMLLLALCCVGVLVYWRIRPYVVETCRVNKDKNRNKSCFDGRIHTLYSYIRNRMQTSVKLYTYATLHRMWKYILVNISEYIWFEGRIDDKQQGLRWRTMWLLPLFPY
jgi:dipeptide/tripeptide permease